MKSPRRILVVDDDESVRDLCALVLATAGYEVVAASGGAEGLDRLRKAGFDLVITDVSMPDLDGAEFYGAASREFPWMGESFMFMTGGAREEQMEAIRAGRLTVLAKPFRIGELLSTVESVMRGRLDEMAGGCGGSRKEGRLSYDGGCALAAGGALVAGTTLDISPNGLRARHAGEAMRAGADVTVTVRVNGLSFERGGRLVWTREQAGGWVSGIELSRPMPVSSIINNMPAKQARDGLEAREGRARPGNDEVASPAGGIADNIRQTTSGGM